MIGDAGEDDAVRIPYATMRWTIGCLCLLILLSACDTPPRAVDPPPATGSAEAPVQPAPPPPPATIQPGDRLALRTRAAGAAAERTLIAFVQADGRVAFDGVGAFDTRNATVRAVEQSVLESINHNGSLVATARLARAPISDLGLFVAIDEATFRRLLMDSAALKRIDAGLDARWQWVRIVELDHARRLPTLVRHGARWTLAEPAHTRLVGDELIAGVRRISEPLTPAAGPHRLTLHLHPATALALEHAATARPPLLAVLDGRLIALPSVTPPTDTLTIPCPDAPTRTRLHTALRPDVSAATQ